MTSASVSAAPSANITRRSTPNATPGSQAYRLSRRQSDSGQWGAAANRAPRAYGYLVQSVVAAHGHPSVHETIRQLNTFIINLKAFSDPMIFGNLICASDAWLAGKWYTKVGFSLPIFGSTPKVNSNCSNVSRLSSVSATLLKSSFRPLPAVAFCRQRVGQFPDNARKLVDKKGFLLLVNLYCCKRSSTSFINRYIS